MRRARTLAACLGVLSLLTLTVSSVRADSLGTDDMDGKLKSNQVHRFNLSDEAGTLALLFPERFEGNNGLHLGFDNGRKLGFESRVGAAGLFSEDFENGNNGKRLGFSVSSTNRGNKFGLFKSPQSSGGSAGGTVGSDAIPNPEPAAVFLLGTGLAAVGAYARRRFNNSSH